MPREGVIDPIAPSCTHQSVTRHAYPSNGHVIRHLRYLTEQCTQRYNSGMGAHEAALDIAFDVFRDWSEAERVAVNVHTIYRELSGDPTRPDTVAVFAEMARVARRVKQ